MSLTPFETLTYNGFTFPVDTYLEVSSRFVYDQAQRTVIYILHTLSVHSLIGLEGNDGTNSDEILEDIHQRLSKAGQALTLYGAGFGDLSVNDGGEKKDVAWGPKPRLTNWKPLGVRNCEFTWVCEVAVPWCEDAAYENRPLAYNFIININRDEQGYTNRIVSGYLEIPMTRIEGGRAMPDCADAYWDDWAPPIPNGMRRTQNQTSLSEDKRRLNFTVTDTEMPYDVFQPNVVECRYSHSNSSHSKALLVYTAAFRAAYVLKKNISKRAAFFLFLQLIAGRINQQILGGAKGFLPLGLSMEDSDIYGRAAGSFAFSYLWFVGRPDNAVNNRPDVSTQLRDLQRQSAQWARPPGDYDSWRASVITDAMSPRGMIKMRSTANDDYITDICDTEQLTGNPRNDNFVPVGAPEFPNITLLMPFSQDATFYIRYDTTLSIRYSSGVAVINKLPWSSILLDFAVPWLGPTKQMLQIFDWTNNRNENKQGEPMQIAEAHVRSTPGVHAVLTFNIVAVGTPPTPPRLTRIGNSTDFVVTKTNSQIKKGSSHFGIDTYVCQGVSVYTFTKTPPQSATTPPDYFLDIGAGQVRSGQADLSL